MGEWIPSGVSTSPVSLWSGKSNCRRPRRSRPMRSPALTIFRPATRSNGLWPAPWTGRPGRNSTAASLASRSRRGTKRGDSPSKSRLRVASIAFPSFPAALAISNWRKSPCKASVSHRAVPVPCRRITGASWTSRPASIARPISTTARPLPARPLPAGRTR